MKKSNTIGLMLYFSLIGLLLGFLVLHSFRLVRLETDFFTRFLLALLFIVLLLPLVPKIKIFDIVEVKRENKMFKANKKNNKHKAS